MYLYRKSGICMHVVKKYTNRSGIYFTSSLQKSMLCMIPKFPLAARRQLSKGYSYNFFHLISLKSIKNCFLQPLSIKGLSSKFKPRENQIKNPLSKSKKNTQMTNDQTEIEYRGRNGLRGKGLAE